MVTVTNLQQSRKKGSDLQVESSLHADGFNWHLKSFLQTESLNNYYGSSRSLNSESDLRMF